MTRSSRALSSQALKEIATRLCALPLEKQRAFLARLEEQGIDPAALPVVPVPRPERIPLSFGQSRLWTLEQVYPGTALYNIPSLFRIVGELDEDALRAALVQLGERHEVLRTTFRDPVEPEGEPEQIIHSAARLELSFEDLTTLPEGDREGRARAVTDSEASRPFELRQGPLFRAKVLRLSATRHWLTIVMHHIVSDEWSGGILAHELVELYRAARLGQAAALPPLPAQYADYALWQRRWFSGKALERQLEYWQEQLPDGDYELNLPSDFPRSMAKSHGGREHAFALPRELSQKVTSLAARLGATPFMLMLGAFQLLLHRYCDQADVRVGVPVTNRSQAGTENAVGFFANTLVLRNEIAGSLRVDEYVERTRRLVLDAQAHRDVPFARVVEALKPSRRVGHTPLFQVMFSWHQAESRVIAAHGLTVEPASLSGNVSRFDLSFHMTDGEDGLSGHIIYRADLFRPESIEKLAKRFAILVEQMVEHPTRRIAQLEWLSAAERIQAVQLWNETAAPYPARGVHEWMADAARARANALLVVGEAEALTGHELLGRADRVARWLMDRGVGLEARVGVCLPRDVSLVVALCGVLESGAAYVPLDDRQPPARLRELVVDSGVRLVLGGEAVRTALAGTGVDVVDPASLATLPIPAAPVSQPVSPESAAYVIYTSGSTGKPKGVVVTHGGLTNYVLGLLDRLNLPAEASMAWVSTVAADLGNTVLFGALCSGRTLHVISDQRAFDPDAFAEYLRAAEVDVLKIVPSHLQALLHAAQPSDVLPRHTLLLGGEAADPELLARIDRFQKCRVVNHYGPTETTVGILTYERPDANRQEERSLPLGRPLPNGLAYVLGSELGPVPPAVVGELYLGGAGVARGYLSRPALTAERFIPNPYASPGSRLYRSGDRARYREDGAIEFLGRGDSQVKLRGYRIEPGEIEARLMLLGGVQAARVVVRHGQADNARLVAYLTGVARDSRALRAELAAELPEHMVPVDYVWLDSFPLTANGKLDFRALPDPAAPAARTLALPGSPIEVELLRIWQEVLKTERVGVHDNFFALGGDSILTLQVVARARRAGIRLTPKQLFTHQTIAEAANVAELVASAGEHSRAALPAPTGEVALTPVQRWFFARPFEERHHYNQSVLLELAAELPPDLLEPALASVVARHPALTLRYQEHAGRWQAHAGALPEALCWRVTLDAGDDSSDALVRMGERAQRSLDLEKGPLLRAVCFTRGPGRPAWLLIVVHHLAVDGMSFRILLEDLSLACQQLLGQEPVRLGPPTTSWAEWAAALNEYASSPAAQAELAYWRGVVATPTGSLRARNPAGQNSVSVAETLSFHLSEERTQQLLGATGRAYRTQVNDLLMTAWALALCEWSDIPSVLIEAEGHGRAELFPALDLSRTVGWFTSLYPLRLEPVRGDLSRSIQAIKEQLRAVPNGGVGYGVLRHLSPWAAELDAHPEPQVTFNYLGQFDSLFDAQSLFRPAEREAGAARAPSTLRRTWLDLQIMIVGGRLQARLEFSKEVHERRDIGRLLELYRQRLDTVVDHCASASVTRVTPSDFPLLRASGDALSRVPLDFTHIVDAYPMTPMQQGLMMHSLLGRGTGVYHMQNVFRIERQLDETAFSEAWQAVARRHAVLRTAFTSTEELGPFQVVYDQPGQVCECLDLRHLSPEQQSSELERLLTEELRQGFDLAVPDLFRVRLIRIDDSTHWCAQSYHHVLMDAWCRSLILRDFFAYYHALLAGKPAELPAAPSFRAYVEWLAQQDPREAQAFWASELEGFERPTPLPFAATLEDENWSNERVDDCETSLTVEQTNSLNELCKELSVTPNTVAQAAWALVLARHAGTEDVLFGVTVAGRPAEVPGVEAIVGLFIQTLPLRVRVPSALLVSDWLRLLFEGNARLRHYDYLPLSEIRRASPIRRGSLFHSLFVFENAPMDDAVSRDGLRLAARGVSDRTHTNYPITVVLYPGRQLGLHLSYGADLFSRPEVEVLLGQFRTALEQLSDGTARRIGQIQIAPAAERAVLAAIQRPSSSEPFVDYVERFEQCVEAWPTRVIARSGHQEWTYAVLNARSNAIAHALIEGGTRADDVIAVLGERDLGLLGACLGVLKAGAGFLPLDPRQPPARALEILRAARPRRVLASSALGRALQNAIGGAEPQLELSFWDAADNESAALGTLPNPRVAIAPAHLAYVIYTSGSTGIPKGVMVSREGMLNNQLSKLPYLGLGQRDVIAQTASQCFDISVWQLLTGALCGAVVEIVPDEIAHHPARLLEHVAQRGVTVWQTVPSLLGSLWHEAGSTRADATPGRDALPAEEALALRWLLATGEALGVEVARRWFSRYPNIPIVNAYGPAECSDDVSLHTLRSAEAVRGGQVPVGVPVDGTQLYVLDERFEPQPIGVSAELYAAGVGLGRGYLGNPRATAAAFIPNPFSRAGERMYRTGDLAKHHPDGSIEFVGRIDHQVKVRGFRIELGDIEARLMEQPSVEAAAVAAHRDEGGHQRLVAYVVPRAGHLPPVAQADAAEARPATPSLREELRAALSRVLPYYMVPSQMVLLDALPVSANGKLDRKALAPPELGQALERHEAPRTEAERAIVAIWSGALGAEKIGLDDNFFDLGGHSLLIVTVTEALSRKLRSTVPLALAFQHQTPRQLARALEEERKQSGLSTLISLQSSGPGAPLFCLHHGGGHLLGYQAIARAFEGVRPVYGLQARSFYRDDGVDSSVQDAVEHYADEIERRLSEPVVHLLGWSLGGILALEVARVCVQRGISVRFVGAIDPGMFQFRAVDPTIVSDAAHQHALGQWIKRSHLRSKWGRLLEMGSEPARQWLLCEFVRRELAEQLLGEAEERELFSSVNWHVIMRDYALVPPTPPVHVWWASHATEDEQEANRELASRLELASATVIGGDHASIVAHPRLHEALRRTLG